MEPAYFVDREAKRLAHWCSGCDCAHIISTASGLWNGDVARPTFSRPVEHSVGETTVCRYVLLDGLLHYTQDCRHDLAGKVVRPGWPASEAVITGFGDL